MGPISSSANHLSNRFMNRSLMVSWAKRNFFYVDRSNQHNFQNTGTHVVCVDISMERRPRSRVIIQMGIRWTTILSSDCAEGRLFRSNICICLLVGLVVADELRFPVRQLSRILPIGSDLATGEWQFLRQFRNEISLRVQYEANMKWYKFAKMTKYNDHRRYLWTGPCIITLVT